MTSIAELSTTGIRVQIEATEIELARYKAAGLGYCSPAEVDAWRRYEELQAVKRSRMGSGFGYLPREDRR